MTTDIIHSIGATNAPLVMDYTSLAAWAAACPSDLTSVDQRWIGEVYNQGEMSLTSQLTISATTSSTNNVVLRAATGASFMDNANAATNPLRYNATTGAAITGNVPYTRIIELSADCEIARLQFRSSHGGQGVIRLNGSNSNAIHECILSLSSDAVSNGNTRMLWLDSGLATASNVLLIAEGFLNCIGVVSVFSAMTLTNCTIVNVAAPVVVQYTNATLNNNALFTGNGSSSSTAVSCQSGRTVSGANNATDAANFLGNGGTNSATGTVSPVGWSAATFKSISGVAFGSGTGVDFRLSTGSALIGAGSAANAPVSDILGTRRPVGGPTDIGAWQTYIASYVFGPFLTYVD